MQSHECGTDIQLVSDYEYLVIDKCIQYSTYDVTKHMTYLVSNPVIRCSLFSSPCPLQLNQKAIRSECKNLT